MSSKWNYCEYFPVFHTTSVISEAMKESNHLVIWLHLEVTWTSFLTKNSKSHRTLWYAFLVVISSFCIRSLIICFFFLVLDLEFLWLYRILQQRNWSVVFWLIYVYYIKYFLGTTKKSIKHHSLYYPFQIFSFFYNLF